MRHAKGLSGYGFWITVSPLSVRSWYGDRFFVAGGARAGADVVLRNPQEGLQRLLIISGACASALLPRLAAALSSVAASLVVAKRLERWRRRCCRLACISSAFLAFLCWRWISPVFAHTALPVTLVLIAGLRINPLRKFSLAPQCARGHPHITGWFHVAELIAYIAAVHLLTRSFGLIGAGIAGRAADTSIFCCCGSGAHSDSRS